MDNFCLTFLSRIPSFFTSRVQCFKEGLFGPYTHEIIVPRILRPIQVPGAIIAKVNTEEGMHVIVEMPFRE